LPAEFKEQAVEKMKKSATVSALAVELGVPRRQLYRWQRQLELAGEAAAEKAGSPDNELEHFHILCTSSYVRYPQLRQ